MDEQQYKNTYTRINPQRCVFEKAINSRVCNCGKARRFNLADREGVACASINGLQRCNRLISLLRENARFTLRRLDVKVLGHAQEIKIQNGGLLGLQSQLESCAVVKVVEDINATVTAAEGKFAGLENLPYSQLMQVIGGYRIRNRRNRP